jgi:hypothetical protein
MDIGSLFYSQAMCAFQSNDDAEISASALTLSPISMHALSSNKLSFGYHVIANTKKKKKLLLLSPRTTRKWTEYFMFTTFIQILIWFLLGALK